MDEAAGLSGACVDRQAAKGRSDEEAGCGGGGGGGTRGQVEDEDEQAGGA